MQSLNRTEVLSNNTPPDLPAQPVTFSYFRFIKWTLAILFTLLTGLAIGWFFYLPLM